MEDGAQIYGDWNWSKGMPLSRFASAAFRHLVQGIYGMEDEEHFSAAVFNIMCIMHGKEMIESGKWSEEFDDIPDFSEELERIWKKRIE